MTIASTVSDCLAEHDVAYDILTHAHTASSGESAEASHVPGARLAKSVVLEDEQGYVMVVLPSSRRVDMGELHRQLKRNLGLATETELGHLFKDCEIGALPALGPAYGMKPLSMMPLRNSRISTSRPVTTSSWCMSVPRCFRP